MNDWTILCLVVLIVSVCIHARLGFVFPFASFRPPSLHLITKKKIGRRDGELLCPGSAALPPSDCDRRSSLFFMFARGTSVGRYTYKSTSEAAWRRGCLDGWSLIGCLFSACCFICSAANQAQVSPFWWPGQGRRMLFDGGWVVGWLAVRWSVANDKLTSGWLLFSSSNGALEEAK